MSEAEKKDKGVPSMGNANKDNGKINRTFFCYFASFFVTNHKLDTSSNICDYVLIQFVVLHDGV